MMHLVLFQAPAHSDVAPDNQERERDGRLKAGEPFGIDAAVLAKIDWELALSRISHDLRSDFIYTPHLGFIKKKKKKKKKKKTVTIEVPKSFRIRVVRSKTACPSLFTPRKHPTSTGTDSSIKL